MKQICKSSLQTYNQRIIENNRNQLGYKYNLIGLNNILEHT